MIKQHIRYSHTFVKTRQCIFSVQLTDMTINDTGDSGNRR